MKLIGDYLVSYLLLFLGKISQQLSISDRGKFGIFVGNMLRILSKSRAEITLNNIKMAFPEISESECIKIMNGSYHNLGITMVELLVFPIFDRNYLEKYIKYDNLDLLNEVYNRGKGLIFLSGHFGNWELLALTTGYFSGLPNIIVVKPQSNQVSDKILNSYRTSKGNRIVPMAQAARAIINSISNKEIIALLVDQSADWQKDLFVDFFGHPAATYEAPAKLSVKYDVPIVMGFAVRQSDFTYRVKLMELDRSGLDRTDEPIKELTIRHVRVLEDIIRKYPDQWSWQHKRWKHTPPKKN